MSESFDALDRRHYRTLDAFRVLLETLSYETEHDEAEGVTVRVPAAAHPLTGFELAMIAQEAVAHGLFDLQVVGSNGPDAPLELFLGIPDADKPLPLWRRVEVPEDYFILADGLPRVVLKFDFDAPEGILFTSSLMDSSDVYIDYEKEAGCQRALEEHLGEVFPEDLERFRRAYAEDDEEVIRQFWLDHFDYEFQNALGEPQAHVIVHCIGPVDKGYKDDYMFFLLRRDTLEALGVPSSYVVTARAFS